MLTNVGQVRAAYEPLWKSSQTASKISWTTAFDPAVANDDGTFGSFAIGTVTVSDLAAACNGNTLSVQLIDATGARLGTEQSKQLAELAGSDNRVSFDVSGQHISAASVDHVAVALAATP